MKDQKSMQTFTGIFEVFLKIMQKKFNKTDQARKFSIAARKSGLMKESSILPGHNKMKNVLKINLK